MQEIQRRQWDSVIYITILQRNTYSQPFNIVVVNILNFSWVMLAFSPYLVCLLGEKNFQRGKEALPRVAGEWQRLWTMAAAAVETAAGHGAKFMARALRQPDQI